MKTDPMRPSIIRTNSRYRGPTGLGNYSNFLLESIHDMKLLGATLDRNENIEGHKGQTDHIKDNFSAYLHGDADITASADSATILFHTTRPANVSTDLMSGDWAVYGSASRSSSDEATVITSPGLLDPAGIGAQLLGEEGDIFYIRMKVKHIEGDTSGFSIGSHNINYGEGDVENKQIPQNGTTIYVDKRLYCRHRGPFTVNIDVHNTPDQLEMGRIEVSEVSIHYAEEHHLAMAPIDMEMKSRARHLEARLKSIINT